MSRSSYLPGPRASRPHQATRSLKVKDELKLAFDIIAKKDS